MKISRLFVWCTVIALGACAGKPPRPEIAATANPQEEIDKLNNDMHEARKLNADVLAADDMNHAQKWLDEARSDSASKQSQGEILDDVRTGRGYLNRANQTTAQRAPVIAAIGAARQAAVDAGAKKFPKQEKELRKIDGDLRDEAGSLDKMKPEENAKLQKRYMDLELASIQETQLGGARALIEGSKKDDADDDAPVSYKQAETDLKNAENVIAAKRNDAAGFAPDVSKANASAVRLNAVMKAIRSNKDLKEPAAIEMVKQQEQIAALNGTIESDKAKLEANRVESAAQLEASKAESDRTKGELASRDAALRGAHDTIQMQKAIDDARQEFTPEEAEVFQQGSKLVVRLKALQFTTGRAELPAHSMEILGKVKGVADQLSPEKVVIEGHTDSTGTAQKNEQLSLERAKIVADYLRSAGIDNSKIETAGFGFEKPIASNKSKAGRAQNRRVDVVITPSRPTRVPQSEATSSDSSL